MSSTNKDFALKTLISNFSSFEKAESGWRYKCDESNLLWINVKTVHIQGKISRTAGFSNEIMIVDDGTSKAKVTRSSQVPGNFEWVKVGEYCSVVGILVDNGKLPHIGAIKIAQIHNKVLQEMWPWEVRELKDLLTKKIVLKLPEVVYN